ncbi:hypothetical protein LB507_004039 [Fusarium sp. FIESC RH6]|nr:hypothetical protein LB507_004039 [Fusarium sp. FIESC RH6]
MSALLTARTSGQEPLANEFFQKNGSVKYVHLQWLDYSGVLRTRIITLTTAKDIAAGKLRYSLAQNCMVIPISTAPACFPDGIEDWRLLPDWTSVKLCGYRQTHATVQCFLAHMGLENPFARCPRHLLSLAVDDLSTHPAKALIGFEIEFVLLDQDHNAARSMDQTVGYSMTAGLRTRNLDIIEKIVDALESSGIGTYHFHVEGADQFEIALSPLPPMEAVDSLMVAQETIRTIALHHGLRGTLAPKPILKGPKSGLHAHLSLYLGLTAMPDHFLAGTLDKLRALCALGLANFDSYDRVAGDCAGEWVGFGTGNKDLPIRRVQDNRWEFRALDATANIYLFMATLLYSGAHGMVAKLQLKSQDCQVVPSALSYEEAKRSLGELGITESVPTSLAESLAALKKDEDIEQWIGKELLTQYSRVKEKEVEYFGKMTEEERRMKFISYF